MHIFSIFKNNLSENIPTQIFGYQEGLVNFDLSTNSFIDSIPLELGNLMHISKLYMYANKFCGVIPWNLVCNTIRASTRQKFLLWESTPFLGSLRSLESNLNLSYNHLYGQVSLEGVFSNITIISLIGNNDLYGGIPQLNLSPCPERKKDHTKAKYQGVFSVLSRIGVACFQEFSTQRNILSGNIPTGIGNLTILSEVHMDFKAFKGSIPFTLIYCKKMHTFNISVNNLSGNIPTQTFGYQEGLVNIDLSTNSFTGSIPLELVLWCHSRGTWCVTLTELRLDKNFFHGSLPPFLGFLRSLERLDLSNNFSSTISMNSKT
ncbi:hypothetical protein Ahy_B10g101464 [Arachis hypogaea]|uniref:LRR receptor-like serine/threonine-protein kinase n=1 Tax=Arachis hypogaea TaxID=3818 RepID=A0A444WZT7_ARAHY|nr:hypothetical protein Ahy_B10g101464 [Arachis hypogaea]